MAWHLCDYDCKNIPLDKYDAPGELFINIRQGRFLVGQGCFLFFTPP